MRRSTSRSRPSGEPERGNFIPKYPRRAIGPAFRHRSRSRTSEAAFSRIVESEACAAVLFDGPQASDRVAAQDLQSVALHTGQTASRTHVGAPARPGGRVVSIQLPSSPLADDTSSISTTTCSPISSSSDSPCDVHCRRDHGFRHPPLPSAHPNRPSVAERAFSASRSERPAATQSNARRTTVAAALAASAARECDAAHPPLVHSHIPRPRSPPHSPRPSVAPSSHSHTTISSRALSTFAPSPLWGTAHTPSSTPHVPSSSTTVRDHAHIHSQRAIETASNPRTTAHVRAPSRSRVQSPHWGSSSAGTNNVLRPNRISLPPGVCSGDISNGFSSQQVIADLLGLEIPGGQRRPKAQPHHRGEGDRGALAQEKSMSSVHTTAPGETSAREQGVAATRKRGWRRRAREDEKIGVEQVERAVERAVVRVLGPGHPLLAPRGASLRDGRGSGSPRSQLRRRAASVGATGSRANSTWVQSSGGRPVQRVTSSGAGCYRSASPHGGEANPQHAALRQPSSKRRRRRTRSRAKSLMRAADGGPAVAPLATPAHGARCGSCDPAPGPPAVPAAAGCGRVGPARPNDGGAVKSAASLPHSTVDAASTTRIPSVGPHAVAAAAAAVQAATALAASRVRAFRRSAAARSVSASSHPADAPRAVSVPPPRSPPTSRSFEDDAPCAAHHFHTPRYRSPANALRGRSASVAGGSPRHASPTASWVAKLDPKRVERGEERQLWRSPPRQLLVSSPHLASFGASTSLPGAAPFPCPHSETVEGSDLVAGGGGEEPPRSPLTPRATPLRQSTSCRKKRSTRRRSAGRRGRLSRSRSCRSGAAVSPLRFSDTADADEPSQQTSTHTQRVSAEGSDPHHGPSDVPLGRALGDASGPHAPSSPAGDRGNVYDGVYVDAAGRTIVHHPVTVTRIGADGIPQETVRAAALARAAQLAAALEDEARSPDAPVRAVQPVPPATLADYGQESPAEVRSIIDRSPLLPAATSVPDAVVAVPSSSRDAHTIAADPPCSIPQRAEHPPLVDRENGAHLHLSTPPSGNLISTPQAHQPNPPPSHAAHDVQVQARAEVRGVGTPLTFEGVVHRHPLAIQTPNDSLRRGETIEAVHATAVPVSETVQSVPVVHQQSVRVQSSPTHTEQRHYNSVVHDATLMCAATPIQDRTVSDFDHTLGHTAAAMRNRRIDSDGGGVHDLSEYVGYAARGDASPSSSFDLCGSDDVGDCSAASLV